MKVSVIVLVSGLLTYVNALPMTAQNMALDAQAAVERAEVDADLAYNKPSAAARAEVDADLAYNKPSAAAK
ncbi:hypothetical protein CCHR01_07290 [Colletotrichum chrysophilum]|uniref:DUF4148 domain-containing protein n=1 Tax=Colletotrichum chrysophilum TaxID=1836956 RepID=A0AAD9EJT6_9PEZI|nr:hypothetical protein CCHR01_07290 [Colletotrichum chrysophilum]